MTAPAPTGEPALTNDTPSASASAQRRQAPSELLSRIWQQSLPLVRDRVARLQHSACCAESGTLTSEARTQAADLAHKLAGSLGMFGFPEGTEIARQLEVLLEAEGPFDGEHYKKQVDRLHDLLPL